MRFLYVFSYRWKQFFRVVETYFFNKSFIPAGGIRIFVWSKQYSFIYSFSFFLWKPLLALKSVSISRNEGFSWNIVSTRNKKNWQESGRSLWKLEKNMVSTSQKISCPLARRSSFIENCFTPNSNNGLH